MFSIKVYRNYPGIQSLPISSLRKNCRLCFVLVLLSTLWSINCKQLQAQDTVTASQKTLTEEVKVPHSPHKATIYAMVLPGLGQIYNQKYWKVPIVYVGFGACIYFISTNTKTYRELRDAYEWSSVTSKIILPPTPNNLFVPVADPPNDWAIKYTETQLKEGREYYRRNLEVSYIFTGVWYVLTVVDAVVDAHFFDYDINDDLTLKIKPWTPAIGTNGGTGFSAGLNLSLHF